MTLLRRVHQFTPTVAYGDAVGNDTFELQRLFWTRGVESDVFGWEAKPPVEAFVRPQHELRDVPVEDGALLVHVSMGNPALSEVAALPQHKAVVYHNITPERFFEGISDQLVRHSRLGREQLRDLARTAELGIADSGFNRRELDEAGYARTAVVPILTDAAAFDVEPDPAVARELAEERTSILVVGQILPQKATADVLEAFARYRAADPAARLYLVGPHGMSGPYLERVREQARRLGIDDAARFTGAVPIEQLAAYYKGATVLLTLSDHEGFNVPLLEAWRNGLPIVANAAGATPETLGDAGVLIERKSPDAVAAAIERVVRDAELRRTLVERGRARLAEFAPERVIAALEKAFALVGWTLPPARTRRIAVLSSDQRCGIHSYSLALSAGLRANGQDVTFVGVRHLDSADLRAKVSHIARGDDVVVEHEAGIFRDVPFVRALLRLRLSRHRILLSLHELEPEKFHHYRILTRAIHYRRRYSVPLEILRVPWVALRIAWAFLEYRTILLLMGGLPERIVVHSLGSKLWSGLLARDASKVDLIPLTVMPIEGVTPPADAAEKRALRERLGLPVDRFVFVSPGFFFARKRFLEVIAALPDDAVLVLSGTRPSWDPEYYEGVMAWLERHKPANVVVNTDFDRTPEYLVASDAVVLYYRDIFQSAVAVEALWAGLPCIFSDIEGFRMYRGVGLMAANDAELATAMRQIREPETAERLRRQVAVMRRMLAPERVAPRYLVGL